MYNKITGKLAKEWIDKEVYFVAFAEFRIPTKPKLIKKGNLNFTLKGEEFGELGCGEDIDILLYTKDNKGNITNFNNYVFTGVGDFKHEETILGRLVDGKMFLYPNIKNGHVYDNLICEGALSYITGYLK